MSDEPLPCADKLVFDTKKQAQDGAVVNRWRYGAKLKPYQCKHCGLWHLATDYGESN